LLCGGQENGRKREKREREKRKLTRGKKGKKTLFVCSKREQVFSSSFFSFVLSSESASSADEEKVRERQR